MQIKYDNVIIDVDDSIADEYIEYTSKPRNKMINLNIDHQNNKVKLKVEEYD